MGGQSIDNRFTNDVIIRAGGALRKAMNNAVPVTHIGISQAKVDSVPLTGGVNKDSIS